MASLKYIESLPRNVETPISPALRLPPDLLYEIFWIASRHPSSQIVSAISQVCQVWRSVVFNAPKLWSIICTQDMPAPGYLENVWIPRTQEVDLTIYFTGSRLDSQPRQLFKLLNVLRPTIIRWKELTVTEQPWAVFTHTFLYLKQHPPSNLRKLVALPISNDRTVWRVPLPPRAISNLTSIETSTDVFDFTDTSQFTAWKDLREVRLLYVLSSAYPLTLPMIYELLSQISPTVEIFVLRVVDYLDQLLHWPEDHTTILHLPRLVHLEFPAPSLYYPFDTSLSEVFHPMIRRICAPLVKRLEDITLSALPMFAEDNPFPNLQYLELLGRPGVVSYHMSSVARAFDHLSLLQSVRFHSITWLSGEYSRALGFSCPALENVSLQFCSGVVEDDLRTMIELRRDSIELSSLRSLHLVDCEPLDMEEDGSTYHWFESQVPEFRFISVYMGPLEFGF